MRREDWPERLMAFVDARRSTPFAWGSHDCCISAFDWVLEATGADPAPELRGRVTARTALREIPHGVRELALRVFGEPLASPALAQRGDVVCVPCGQREALGVCIGTDAVVVSTVGWAMSPMETARAAWRIT